MLGLALIGAMIGQSGSGPSTAVDDHPIACRFRAQLDLRVDFVWSRATGLGERSAWAIRVALSFSPAPPVCDAPKVEPALFDRLSRCAPLAAIQRQPWAEARRRARWRSLDCGPEVHR